MFKTVVWASDGSENAARALPYARALLVDDGAMLIAVHIVLGPQGHLPDLDAPESATPSDLAENVRTLVSEVSEQGLKAALKVANYVGPQPAKAIADIAREVRADVIVVGTRGHSRIGGAMLGSVTQSLLHIAPCPVLAVPPQVAEAGETRDTELKVTAG